ncbi:MAG TPA: aldehyde dehydrogenase [Acidimicrobiales bacterium]
MIEQDRLYIGGELVAPAGTGTIEVINPFTEEVAGRVPEATNADVDLAVSAARTAFDTTDWSTRPLAERAAVLTKASALIQGRMDELTKLISTEMGSPSSWAMLGQVLAPSMILDFYAGLKDSYVTEERREGMFGPVLVRKEAMGVVAAIIPWNVPLFEAVMKVGPAVIAGCTVVLKPAPETPLDAYVFAEIMEEAGLPKGVLSILPAGREVGEYLVTHPLVDKVTFTGSTAAGMKIGAACGGLLRPVTLELGGKSAAIILDDADLGTIVPQLIDAGVMNNGQACVAQTRILASRKRYDEVLDAFTEAVGSLVVGDPMDAATQIGPLVAQRQRERVLGLIESGKSEGARVTTGGGRPDFDKGWFVEPTVFGDVSNKMTIAQEEIFGPVLSVIPYDDDADAVAIANDSPYGLSGSVWSADAAHATDLARQVRTGTINVNHFGMAFGAPFGGYKNSGLGRELGPEGVDAFMEKKALGLDPAAG